VTGFKVLTGLSPQFNSMEKLIPFQVKIRLSFLCENIA